jgi:hypothetical protein
MDRITPMVSVPSSDSFMILYNQLQSLITFVNSFADNYNDHTHYFLGTPGPDFDKVLRNGGPTDPEHQV